VRDSIAGGFGFPDVKMEQGKKPRLS
jgi:hypothetical protein